MVLFKKSTYSRRVRQLHLRGWFKLSSGLIVRCESRTTRLSYCTLVQENDVVIWQLCSTIPAFRTGARTSGEDHRFLSPGDSAKLPWPWRVPHYTLERVYSSILGVLSVRFVCVQYLYVLHNMFGPAVRANTCMRTYYVSKALIFPLLVRAAPCCTDSTITGNHSKYHPRCTQKPI